MIREITWINKPGGSHNPSTHIIEVGGYGWRRSAIDVINDILNGRDIYTVSVNGQSVVVELGIRLGRYYLRTRTDGTPLDNLLSLRNVAV